MGDLDRTIFSLAAPGQPKDSPLRYGKVSRIENYGDDKALLFVVGEGADARRMAMLDDGTTIAVGDWVYWLDQGVPLGLGKVRMGDPLVVPGNHPTFLGWTKSATNTPGTAHSITLPGTTAANELLLAITMWNANTTITGMSGWTKLSGSALSPGQSEIWAKIATGSDGASVAATSSTSNAGAFMVGRFSGNFNSLVSGTGYKLSVTAAVTTSAPDPPSVTPDWGSADDLIVVAGTFRGDNATFTGYPAGYTDGDYQVTTNGGGGGASVGAAIREFTGTVEDPGVMGLSASQYGCVYTIAIRPD